MRVLLLIGLLPLLIACVTEEGEKRHAAQAGATWHGTVYAKPGSDVQGESVGVFSSQDECAAGAMAHIKEKDMRQSIYSCNVKS